MTNIALPSERPAPETRHNTGLGAAALASEESGQRGDSSKARAHSASEDARERADDTRRKPGSSALAMLRHARYILGENAVTGFAFALFLLIVLAALIGPYLVPYDP
ncbi:MAG: hypothetical protein ACXU87_26685, partial [Xanthobacteraceae bacterium]